MKIKIIKKNDDYSLEYEVGDIFDTTGMWYGGVHIAGRSGIPVSLDKTEYVVLEDEELEKSGAEGKVSGKKNVEVDNEADSTVSGGKMTHDIRVGDVVRHFKREWVSEETSEYLYRVIAFATHTESEEKLVIYQALYAPFKTCARPYEMIMSEVEHEKYTEVRQSPLHLFELRQYCEQHDNKTQGSSDDIGNGFCHEYAVCTHTEGIWEEICQRYDNDDLTKQGEENRLLLFI